jgi:hypothetical protein
MEDLLIETLEAFGYPVILQGSLLPDEPYPDHFFTFWNNDSFGNSYYDNANYAAMVEEMKKISELYNVGLIDLYCDTEFNNITAEERKKYMADNIHPTKSGYIEWWTPKIERFLYEYLGL